jgi:hypothetical protein
MQPEIQMKSPDIKQWYISPGYGNSWL